jgi:hypothetical protein
MKINKKLLQEKINFLNYDDKDFRYYERIIITRGFLLDYTKAIFKDILLCCEEEK